ncbi:hypothetical protein Mgra_00003431 [Meloidogyne graminicola]|uniref:Uncharacterized protein n=1 Tax=Meloidogyne graminicola TaxID=189291 RepID=A0A8S9ZTL1_9BILA|nr:hypothetical protein Mgra_00003431 [Meloidogyne graminicola]
MTSSNSNLNREDSFTNLSDIMGERAETFSTTSQMTDQDIIAIKKKFEEFAFEITGLKKNNAELASELKKLKEVKAVNCFVKVSNKWKYINSACCSSNCVNTDNPNTICNTYGFIQITSNNKEAEIYTDNCFKKPESSQLCLNCSNHSLYYYEVKLIIERSKPVIEIGFRSTPSQNIYFCVSGGDNKEGIITAENYFKKPESTKLCLNCATYSLYYYEIKLIIEKSRPVIEIDIIGCGVVYPPPNINNNKLPYIFFTKNGELIVKIK